MKRLIALFVLAIGVAAPMSSHAQGVMNLILDSNNTSVEPDGSINYNFTATSGGSVDITGYIQNPNSYAEVIDSESTVGPLDPNNGYQNTSNATFTDELTPIIFTSNITVPANSQTPDMTIFHVQMANVTAGTQVYGEEYLQNSSNSDSALASFTVTGTAAVPEFSTMAMLVMGSGGALLQGVRRARKSA